jgi:hypothetical protein
MPGEQRLVHPAFGVGAAHFEEAALILAKANHFFMFVELTELRGVGLRRGMDFDPRYARKQNVACREAGAVFGWGRVAGSSGRFNRFGVGLELAVGFVERGGGEAHQRTFAHDQERHSAPAQRATASLRLG